MEEEIKELKEVCAKLEHQVFKLESRVDDLENLPAEEFPRGDL